MTPRKIAKEIRAALIDSAYGRSGRNVYAKNITRNWTRIIDAKTVRPYGLEPYVLGQALNTGEWFHVAEWEVR